MPFLAAMWIGEAIWLSAAVFGLSLLAETFHGAFLILKYAGVAYLLFLAWKMWHAPVTVADEALPEAGSAIGLFASGMAVTLGNPKLMAFYVALLPSLIDVARVGALAWAELVLVMLVVLMTVDLAWVAAASYARRWLRSPRAVRLSNRIGATAMGGAAVTIAAK
jgi:threonine/homoserine/homoserine lactone efflux protein